MFTSVYLAKVLVAYQEQPATEPFMTHAQELKANILARARKSVEIFKNTLPSTPPALALAREELIELKSTLGDDLAAAAGLGALGSELEKRATEHKQILNREKVATLLGMLEASLKAHQLDHAAQRVKAALADPELAPKPSASRHCWRSSRR